MNAHVNWTHEETHALIAVWSEEKIQCGLGESVRNERVYGEVSRRLAAMGMYRSAKQCRDKVKKLKLEYRRIKKCGEGNGDFVKSFRWFDALDSILSPATDLTQQSATVMQKFMVSDGETKSPSATEISESYSDTFITCPASVSTHYKSENLQDPEFYSIQVEDDDDAPSTSNAMTSDAMPTSVKYARSCSWSKREVQTLLTLWANPAVQKELLLNVRNNQVYARLSAALESLGFHKTPQKCREKIKKLKQDYKRMKSVQHRDGRPRARTTVWFSIMDDVLSAKTGARRYSMSAQRSVIGQPQTVEEEEEDNDDVNEWLPDEVQVLMTLWAQPNIQEQLLRAEARSEVFKYLSSELALVGFNKTPQQCSLKVNDLKEEYRKIKEVEVKSNWFTILDGVLGPGGAKSSDSSAVTPQSKSAEYCQTKDASGPVWTSDEVKVLVTQWAEPSVQEQLRSAPTDERVFAQLSSDLATQGFDRTTSQCRSQIRLLKEKYRVFKDQKDCNIPKGSWISIMDSVLSCGKLEAETKQTAHSALVSLQISARPECPNAVKDERACHLSISSLCLLVPTLRLMCAFAWQVIQCSNVVHYGKVEELVRVATELIPELLTPTEKVQILLRLRARMVFELCRSESTANLLNIQPHLTLIKKLTTGSTCDHKELDELENSKSNFLDVIQRLLEDKEERKMFFKEVFPIHYGKQFQHTLQTSVWKFISRLDQLLPIPDIKQTAEWLSSDPSAMEECGRLVLDPDQLKELLDFHQEQSGSKNKSFAQSQNMFLPKLSLPPKQSTRWTSEQQALPARDEEEGGYYFTDDEDFTSPVEDGSKEDEVMMMTAEQNEDLMNGNCSSKQDLKNHPPLSLQTCSQSSYPDSQGSGVVQHIRENHMIQAASRPDSDKVFQKSDASTSGRPSPNSCEYCGKTFKFLSLLQSHIKTHTLPFHCDKCDKKYASMKSLHVHLRNHTGETPYLCSHCGRGFRTSHSLRSHVSIHTGEKRYECHICGKTSIQHLARHMRMHRGEKNYLCTECGKAFLSSGELRLHTRYHTGERPYTCKHCGKGFVAKCFLTVHMRRHTGENPYKCTVCPKSFRTLRAQKKHMLIHENTKSFQCLECGKIFRQEDTYNMHLQTHK